MAKTWIGSLTALVLLTAPASAASDEKQPPLSSKTFAGLELRSLGPAMTSGRVADLAVDPTDASVWFVAAASGGVWKTTNSGNTWSPVFDGEGSYSIGAVAIDPNNPNVVWVGTGENNNQRSVSYGDGVYRSLDGGASWTKVGLESSEHIGRILVDPRDSRVVWVAAQGPLWSSGGDRGLYKTTDFGKTWKRVLSISDDTGVTDVVFDPRDPDLLIAAAHQRRRHVWTYVGGGPESALYKSTDGGATWRKLESGLPEGDMGRIGLALSPVDPDIVYAVIEAEEDLGGFFRSTDRGESWEKRSDHSTSGNYYTELVADPFDADRVYSMDTFLKVTDDGGKSFRDLGEKSKHVDNHAMWIDPTDREHYVVGCDGGLYESFDEGANWRFFDNLPITQFYRLGVDNSEPFYRVCGGTQDNFTLCGPSRTLRFQGPANEDWEVAQGGDGFWTVSDPTDPNIVYAEAQHGVLTRFDRRSGENVDIQPMPAQGETPYNWNWDAPLVLSPHSPTRLYFAANRVFRSDDRGNSWTAISPDLTRGLDRTRLEVFGRIQRPEAVARNRSTSVYGNLVSLAESPLVEGLLYAGTDDGLIQVSEDGGGTWRRIEKFPGVPELAYVSRLVASRHDADVVYSAFDHHKSGDFRPLVLRSSDRGRSWTSIAADLPERGTVYALVEDPVDSELLFVGTEFGLFFRADAGKRWIRLEGGLPTIAVRDLAFQEREDDLVLATFGRGFYVLDDVSPLRGQSATRLEADAILYPVAGTELFVPGSRIGSRDNGFLGETYFTARNPPFGAAFTWYLKEDWKSNKKIRQESEKEALEKGRAIDYPSLEALRAETRQEDAKLAFVVTDSEGEVVRRLAADPEAGLHRIAWDLRYPPADPVTGDEGERSPWLPPVEGSLIAPGTYSVRLELHAGGATKTLSEPRSFEVGVLGVATLAADDRAALRDFQRRTARLQRAVMGAEALVSELGSRLKWMRGAIPLAMALDAGVDARARALELELEEISIALSGDQFLASQQETTPPSISDRVLNVVYASWYATAEPTTTQRDAYRHAGEEFAAQLTRLRSIVQEKLPALERELESAGAPWTPGRLPVWSPEP